MKLTIAIAGCIINLFIFTSSLHAQITVAGRVLDQEKHAIQEATLAIAPLTDSTLMQNYISPDGTYKFNIVSKGIYVLRVTHIGYKPQALYFQLNGDTTLGVTLMPFTAQLHSVQISAHKNLLEKKADRTVFNISSSIMAKGGNALSALAQIPSVKVNGSAISIVGKGTVKVLLNGKLIQMSDENLTRYLTSYSTNSIEKIEVITSPSARYDADGNAGLINIITKRSNMEGWTGSVQTNYKYANKYHTGGITGDVHYQKNKWTLFGNANVSRWKELEGWIIGVEYPDRSWSLNDTGVYSAQNYSGTIGIDYQLSDHATIGAVYSAGYLEYEGHDDVKNYHTSRPSGMQDSIVRSYAVYDPVALNNSLNLHLLTKLDTVGTGLSIDADYFNYYRTDFSNFKGWTQVPDISAPKQSLMKYYNTAQQNILIYTLKADLSLPTPFVNLSIGAKLSFIHNYSDALYYNVITGDTVYDKSKSNEFSYIENTQAFYINTDKKIGDWSLQAGLRAELTKTTGHSFTLEQVHKNDYFKLYPSALINWRVSDASQLSASFTKRIERPSFWTLNPYRSLLTSFAYYDGNPALQPAYTSQFELTHRFKKRLTSSLYYSHTKNGFDNLTIGSADTNLVYRTPLNFLTIDKVGLSETIQFSLFSWWQSTNEANLYYTRARSSLDIVRGIDGWGKYLSTSNNFYLNQDKTFSGAINFWIQFPEVDHIGRSNTYSSMDIGFMYSAPDKRWDLALNATDIFKNSAPTFYTTVNGLAQSYDNFQLARSIMVAFTYKFGNNRIKSAKRSLGNEAEKSRL